MQDITAVALRVSRTLLTSMGPIVRSRDDTAVAHTRLLLLSLAVSASILRQRMGPALRNEGIDILAMWAEANRVAANPDGPFNSTL
jgi:hypothetical protein